MKFRLLLYMFLVNGNLLAMVDEKEASLITNEKVHISHCLKNILPSDVQSVVLDYLEEWTDNGKLLNIDGPISLLLNVDCPANVLAFSSKNFLAAGVGRFLKIWTKNYRLITLQAHAHAIQALSFSYDGKYLALGLENSMVRIWQFEDQRQEYIFLQELQGHTSNVNCVAFSPNGLHLATGSKGCVKIWKHIDGKFVEFQAIKINNPLKKLDDAENNYCPYKMVHDVVAVANKNKINTLSFSSNNAHLVIASIENITIWKFNDKQWKLSQTIENQNIATFAPNAQYLATGGSKNILNIWHFNNEKFERIQALYGIDIDRIMIKSIIFSADSNYIISSHDEFFNFGSIKIWKFRNRKYEFMQEISNSARVVSIAISADNKTIAAAALDQNIRLWKNKFFEFDKDKKLEYKPSAEKSMLHAESQNNILVLTRLIPKLMSKVINLFQI
jgi:WD40 repeat protein